MLVTHYFVAWVTAARGHPSLRGAAAAFTLSEKKSTRLPERRNRGLTGKMAALPKEPGTSCDLGRPRSLAALLLLSPTVKP